ncbi:PCI domain-containing protein [Cryptosporidium muris RN66]|uniref:PCI domain-containing protein n=1 Tax=Cryptosporidium muris (strain RN66) TaxID=441375 RepID=B6ACS6_CRYMR|nr:PCI domain-containing protein [Cryptosporidium muris RN66]EEA05930.1 PCI domain-containing protein [Cryptosporidium muris RN66]|eukprot:XP_002140279.1 PCI domain-containing protein [Cryptosporidium muris RN66]
MNISLADKFEQAKSLDNNEYKAAEIILLEIINSDNSAEDTAKLQELAIYRLGEIYVDQGEAEKLRHLFVLIRPVLQNLPKARTAKVVRSLMDLLSKIPNSEKLLEELCLECIQWCNEEKRTFLRHRITTRLAMVYLNARLFSKGLECITELVKEVKKVDDKVLLVEIYLIESKLQYRIKDLPKTKAALTAARTNANAIHCPPLLQADIDLQSGIVLADEKDYATSFSYFYEAFEAFNIGGDSRAPQALKYMMLAKIMSDQPDNISVIITAKNTIKFQGRDIEALKMVARCRQQRSLKMFEDVLLTYDKELSEDLIIKKHIDELYESLLEQNIQRILEAYSQIEISQLAQFLELPIDRIHNKLTEMILDKTIYGNIDQRKGILRLVDRSSSKPLFDDILMTLTNLSDVVDALYEKAAKVL